jgi:hypothetical protein
MVTCPNCDGPVPFYYWHAHEDDWCCDGES